MQCTWWGFGENFCPKCESKAFQMEVHYSSDGQIRFWYSCPECRESFHQDYFASQLQAIALGLDLERRLADFRPSTVRKPQHPPAIVEKLTKEDKKLERSMGIDPGEDGQ